MGATYLLAIDLGKRHFQVCGTDVIPTRLKLDL
ncbi:hypothetical protein SAMN05880556_106136 [Azospirillum sp. RU38E]|nr:hypothetical protein SAMN05880556_106136 [Azospirillum sp. RU38E]SNS73073.1 hypothetical protein SAMN05880591_106165 [Azospirillum sp. RU37A]